MMNGADPGLRVFLGEQPIARLQQHEDQLLWHYEPHWLQQGFAISPHLPLETSPPPLNVQRFLRNLLPEGAGFEELLAQFQLARHNTFGLILDECVVKKCASLGIFCRVARAEPGLPGNLIHR